MISFKKPQNKLIYPIILLGLSLIALALFLYIGVNWYIDINDVLNEALIKFKLSPNLIFQSTWQFIFSLFSLFLVVLTGLSLLFLYYVKTMDLYRLQNNFINNFTHELKTPVTSLKLYLETFLKYELSREDQRKYLNYMIQDVGRLSETISGILNLGRIESRKFEGEFVTSEIGSFINNTINTNTVFKDCEIIITPENPEQYYCKINRVLFDMLFMNIITNSIKYNNSGTPEINITYKKGKKKLILTIKDNGIGIDKKDLKRVYDKFYQIKRKDHLSLTGSGLGLYIVYNVVRIHNWDISIKSEGTGKGTSVILTIPIINIEL
ncbi:MAG: HAMP domain-containing histidine kinase [Desulfobacterales bacterium]|nr:HAMP domain-containing histidine kinase [Desulfobacterales bacterium]